ncbi:MAG: tRNA lysidine(34) synthetase TilS [Candidatus Neomarinimicrobiota bacterium]
MHHTSNIFIELFRERLKQFRLVNNNQRILVACSGGSDSMALLYAFYHIQEDFHLELTAGHVNHHLRVDSDDDQEVVIDACKKLNINFVIDELFPDDTKFADGMEAWAREKRYAILEKMRKKSGAHLIATAHHGNDQVETILFRLSRGTGIQGTSGIRRRRDNIIRPLLSFSKREILDFVNSYNIQWVEDPTNLDEERPRNFLRNKIIPDWEKKVPGLIATFEKFSENSDETFEALNTLISEFIVKYVDSSDKEQYRISKQSTAKFSPYLKSLIIKQLSTANNIQWSHHIWDGIKIFFKKSSTGNMLPIKNGWIILNDRNDWILRKELPVISEPIIVEFDKDHIISDFIFKATRVKSYDHSPENNLHEFIDGDVIKGNKLKLRTWDHGDKFSPLGMKGHKKVSDLLTDIKMDRFSKMRQLVLCANEEIIWVCGVRISQSVRITNKTTHYVELSIVPRVD